MKYRKRISRTITCLWCSTSFETKREEQKFCSCACANSFNFSQKDAREHKSQFMKRLWEDPEYRDKLEKLRSSSKFRKNLSQSARRQWQDPKYGNNAVEVRENKRQIMKKLWEDPEYREKTIKATFKSMGLRPNKPEINVLNILQRMFPNEYKYVGDGSFLVGFKNPDFINVNGQKKIIELFGDYWHGEERTGTPIKQHVQERKDVFAKYGYQTLVIWEHELENVKTLSNRILEFNNI